MNDDLMTDMMQFGVGLAVAQQMVNTMNSAMGNMTVPTVHMQAPQLPIQKAEFYVVVDDNVAGPFDEPELISLIQKGKLTENSLVWRKGLNYWCTVNAIPEVKKLLLLYK